MSRIYSEEEKRNYIDRYRVSGKSKTAYAKENDIPEATFRGWIKEETEANYGVIEMEILEKEKIAKPKTSTIFANENIRIELKDGYDKKLLKRIIEVLIDDK